MKTKGLLMIVFLIGMFFSAQAADHVKGNGKLSTKKNNDRRLQCHQVRRGDRL